jgi:hypothetical protein
MDTIVEAATFD